MSGESNPFTVLATSYGLDRKRWASRLGTFLLLASLVVPISLAVVGVSGQPDLVRLSGYIKSTDGVPLANCYIYVSDQDHSFVGDANSDEAGYYELYVSQHEAYNLDVDHYSDTDPYLYDYIPGNVEGVERGDTVEIRIDFRLKPGANIVLHTYDSNGALLQYKDFRTATNSHAYVTDLNNLPYYGVLRGVHDEASDWDLPAFVVLPGIPTSIHVQWEIPGFGEIILSPDNEGDGYVVDSQGDKLVLNFNYEAAKSKLAALQTDYDLFVSQGYDISDSVGEDLTSAEAHLVVAEGYLNQDPPEMQGAIQELDLSLNHALWAHEQLHLDKAQVDINTYRKGNARLTIVDHEGSPIPGCSVSFQQIRHDFLFGASPTGRIGDPVAYAGLLREAGINYAYMEASYKGIEPSPGEFDWDGTDPWVQDLLDEGFKVFGAVALWCYRSDGLGDIFCPTYFDDMSLEELKTNIYEHMYALVGRYKQDIDTWEINEPNAGWTNPLNLTWDQRFEIYEAAALGIRDADPTAKVLYDSNALPYEFGVRKLEDTGRKVGGISFPEFLNLIVETGIPFDVIGLEFYYSDGVGYGPPGLDLVSISSILDQYSSFGKPIYVRELSAPSSQVPDTSWWHRPWDEETQAEYLSKFYTIAFSKPLVQEIGWSWGIVDGNTFLTDGGLFHSDLTPKLSYHALKDLLASWTTDGKGRGDGNGEFEFRGFAGEYALTVRCDDGEVADAKIHLREGEDNSFSIVVSHKVYLPLVLKSRSQ